MSQEAAPRERAVLRSGEGQVVPDGDGHDTPMRSVFSASHVIVAVPVSTGTLGLLHGDHHPSDRPTDDVDRDLLAAFAQRHPEQIDDRKVFLEKLKPIDRELAVRLSAPELKAVVSALSERDENAEICRNRDGEAEPDAELRDTENVPLKESIQAYFEREVLPHVPDAWVDHSKTKVGYEIPLNRHFYRYEPPRDLAVLAAEIKDLETDIIRLLAEVTA